MCWRRPLARRPGRVAEPCLIHGGNRVPPAALRRRGPVRRTAHPYRDARLKLARTAANNCELLLGRHPLMRSLGYFAYLSFACSVAFKHRCVASSLRCRASRRWSANEWRVNTGSRIQDAVDIARPCFAAALSCGEATPRKRFIPSRAGQPCPRVTARYEARRVLGSVLASKIQQDRGESPGRTTGLARRRASWMASGGQLHRS
jgi:hypothetical protein